MRKLALGLLIALATASGASAQCVGGISNCPPAVLPLGPNDLVVVDQVNPSAPTGYTTRKASVVNLPAPVVVGVTSVTNSDGSLSFSPTTGSAIGSLNVGHANTWVALQTFSTSPPFSVSSTTNVPNLNASLLNGNTFASPGAIGGTTPSSGSFTTLAASGSITGPIGNVTPSSGSFTTLAASGNITTNITGAGFQCVHASATGVLSALAGQDCNAAASGTVTSVTCPGAGTFTVSGTCAIDVQIYAAGTTPTWSKVTGTKWVKIFGCAAGGGGGSGAIVTSGTASSGGAGGGAGDCHWIDFQASDLAGTVSVSVAATSSGGTARSQTTNIAGNVGTNGANTTFGALHTWFGGGGGGAGQNSAAASTGGSGGGPFSAGGQATNTASCSFGTVIGNGGNAGGAGTTVNLPTGCPTGGAGSSIAGVAGVAGYSGDRPSGGGGGGGITTGPAANAGGAGGSAPACQPTGPSNGGAINTTATPATQDFSYHPGCGGGGGGSNVTATGATAGSGANGSGAGAGGGGGGSVLAGTPANTSGAGGQGSGGIMVVLSF
jgi:hypothetical protein